MTCEEMFERYELNLTQIALEDEHRFRCRQTRTKCLRARAMHGHLVYEFLIITEISSVSQNLHDTKL